MTAAVSSPTGTVGDGVPSPTTSDTSEGRTGGRKRRGRPAPDNAGGGSDGVGDPTRSLVDRMKSGRDGGRATPRRPIDGPSALRFVMSVVLTLMCLVTVSGAILMLLLWQQDRASGVLSSQLDRTWDLFDMLAQVERWLAVGVVPVATVWIALATLNVRRATGKTNNPLLAAISLPVALIGVFEVGQRVIADADDWLGKGAGWVLQAVLLAIPLLALQRVTESAEARQRPLHITYVIAVLYLGLGQFLGGLSTIDRTDDPKEWALLGAYLIIGALLQVLGALAANEATRSVEEGAEQRFQLRSRFGETLLAQAAARV